MYKVLIEMGKKQEMLASVVAPGQRSVSLRVRFPMLVGMEKSKSA